MKTHPVLNGVVRDVVARRDHPALVQPPVELDDDLSGAVVVDKLEFADVALFSITARNLTTTFEEGRRRTWRFPRFSALESVLRASPRTLILTMVVV